MVLPRDVFLAINLLRNSPRYFFQIIIVSILADNSQIGYIKSFFKYHILSIFFFFFEHGQTNVVQF